MFDAPQRHYLKFKMVLPTELTNEALTQIDIEASIYGADAESEPVWKKFNLGTIGTLSPDKREVWCTIPYAQMSSTVRPPPPPMGNIEFSSLDWCASTSSSFEDSNNFESRIKFKSGSIPLVSARGPGNSERNMIEVDHGGEVRSIPGWAAKANREYFIGGGAAYVDIRLAGGGGGKKALCREQVDWLYLSVHGWHSADQEPYPSACIELTDWEGDGASGHREYVLPEEVEWNKDLDLVVIAGCSVLDINDYNDNYLGSKHNDSPGKRWADTGPSILLGYNAGGPADRHAGENIAFNWGLHQESHGQIGAWRDANREASAWNACAISVNISYSYFHTTTILGGTVDADWTTVPWSEL